MSSIVCNGGSQVSSGLGFLDLRARSCTRYNRLAPKLRNSPAYPVKMSTTWTKIQPLRNSGDVKAIGFCPRAEANVRTNTMGNMTTPGETVRYPTKKIKKTTIARKARIDSE